MLENNEKATIETLGCDGILETESIQQRLGAESLSAQTTFVNDEIFFLHRLLSCSRFWSCNTAVYGLKDWVPVYYS